VALVDLLAGLKAEAAAEEAALEAETREEVERIGEEARAEVRLLREQVVRAVEEEVGGEADRRRASARLAARAAVRQAHEEAFRDFLARVRQGLDALRDSASYPSVLRALIRESLTALPAANVLRVDPRDERLAEHLLGELGAELKVVAVLETAGGVELTSGESRTVRNTIEERLANAEPALRLLFGRSLRVEGP
jgi:vacuolar-type H+-ATPase subunit E/Vma4